MCEHCSFFTKTQEPYSFLLERREWLAKRQIILARDNNCCQRCGAIASKELSLHVHHKHYITGLDPWEYKDSELITLCEKCHSYIHENSRVPIYRLEDGHLVEVTMTPCYRCHGAGRFPEYKHVQNGICFRCHGARYEELIDVVEDYADEHNINLQDYDDGFRYLAPEIEQIGKLVKAQVRRSNRNSGNYLTLVFDNGRIAYCCLDYSVQAEPGDLLEISTLKFKTGIKTSGEQYPIIKGNVIIAESD